MMSVTQSNERAVCHARSTIRTLVSCFRQYFTEMLGLERAIGGFEQQIRDSA